MTTRSAFIPARTATISPTRIHGLLGSQGRRRVSESRDLTLRLLNGLSANLDPGILLVVGNVRSVVVIAFVKRLDVREHRL